MKKSLLLLAPLVFLTGCLPFMQKTTSSSSSEAPVYLPVSFEEFHNAAVEAAKKENGYTKVVVDGKAKIKEQKDGKSVVTEYTFDKFGFNGFTHGRMDAATISAKYSSILSEGNEEKVVAFSLAVATAETVGMSDNNTYYTRGFQVVFEEDGSKTTVNFDDNGLPIFYIFSGNNYGSVSLKWYK